MKFVQRKFAQGVPIPASSTSAAPAPPERKSEPPNTMKNVVHNSMPARTFLDIVSMQNVHKHQQEPMVVLERLPVDKIPPSPAVQTPARARCVRSPSIGVPLRRRKGNMCLRSGAQKRNSTDAGKGSVRKRKKLPSESTDDIPLFYYVNKSANKDKDTTAPDESSFTFKEPASPVRLSSRISKQRATVAIARQVKKRVAKDARLSSLRSARVSSETHVVRRLRSKVLLSKKPPKPSVKKAVPKTKNDEPTPKPGPSRSEAPTPVALEPMNNEPTPKPGPSRSEAPTPVALGPMNNEPTSRPGPSHPKAPIIEALEPNSPLPPDWRRESLGSITRFGCFQVETSPTSPDSRRESLESITQFLASKEELRGESPWIDVDTMDPVIAVVPQSPVTFSPEEDWCVRHAIGESNDKEVGDNRSPRPEESAETHAIPSDINGEEVAEIPTQTAEQTSVARKQAKAAPKEPKKTLPKRAANTATPQEEAGPSTSNRFLRNSREPPAACNPDVYEFDAELEASRPPSGLRRRDSTLPTTAESTRYTNQCSDLSRSITMTPQRDDEDGESVGSASVVYKNEVYKKQKNMIDNVTNSPALLNKLFNSLPTELRDELGNLATSDQNRKEAYMEHKARSVLEAPTFYPTAEEFEDPIKYYDKIAPEASKYGLCKIVPPEGFKPECTVSDHIRFAVIYQYIYKMYNRWGPVSRELAAIKAHLRTQSVLFSRPPILDGSEVNLLKLYHVVERNGGISRVIQRKLWGRVAEEMKLTKLQNPERKLDSIYMRFLLPYATLSDQERQSIMASVERGWTTKYQKMLERARNPSQRQHRMLGTECESESDDEAYDADTAGALNEAEDCIVQGRNINLLTFKKIATSLMDAHFEPGAQPPSPVEVEKAYWRAVLLGTDHIVSNTASIDTGEEGYGFPKDPEAEYGAHPWNLKVVARNPNNVLRYLGDVLGVTVPTLHLGMLFSTSCWHRDPHGLPWIEYLHSGAEKIWYGIPREESTNFRRAVETLCPAYCQNKPIWLASEITMVPPNILSEHGVKLSRLQQKPGEYVLVFPEATTCSITTGFTISESVYFASKPWLTNVYKLFQELRNSCEPTMFSLEQLLLSGSNDPDAPPRVRAVLATLVGAELEHRRELERKGLKVCVLRPPAAPQNTRAWNTRAQEECDYCRSTLFLSKVTGINGRKSAFCPEHALRLLECKKYKHVPRRAIAFLSSYTTANLEEMSERLETRSADESRAPSVTDLTGPAGQ